jgi:crotonobetainyl-CoA:carnitine CoA-transferase CaiB-like acyl-CoA transferase
METMTVAELTAAARLHDVPLAKVHTLPEFLEHPQARHNNTFPVSTDPEFGAMRGLTFPARFGGTPLDLDRRAPKLGEHTADVLGEAGFTTADIDRLRAGGAIR